MIKLTRAFASLCFLLGFCTISFAAEPITIKFATVAPEGSTWMNTMKELEKTIREKTQGQIAFRVYAGGVAGDELDALRKIRIGQLQSAAFSGVGFGQILPSVRVLDLPFLFRNDKEIDLVHKEMEGFFAEQFRQKDFELLSWAEVGNVHLFSQEPIRRVGDMAKLKVWTWSGDPIAKETFSAMGTNPIPLAITDVTTALNTGMIDTVYAPPLGAIALQWNLYVKYMTALPLTHSTGAVLLSKNFAQKIPAEHFKIIKDEFHRSMERLTIEIRKQTEESVALLEKGGIKILPMPQDADLKGFYRVHEQVAQALTGKLYPKDILDKVYDLLKKNR
ncbi:MAG: TRAP-type C4-dicarboxylate transport system, substrate-binding protein [Deltaproteobacteria bacterium]|nr:TRAP-type C4-dicarboxylate transport system, substrate-binding protein [Deltaproteobacteria bacterium]